MTSRLLIGCAICVTCAIPPAQAVVPSYEMKPATVEFLGSQYFRTVNLGRLGFLVTHDCSGTAIAPNLVLTAAHCFDIDSMTKTGEETHATGTFGMYRPGSWSQVAVGQGNKDTIREESRALGVGWVRGSSATAFGRVDQVAMARPGMGPDLAIARVAMDGFDSFFYESRLATGPTVLQTFDYARKDVDPKSVGLSMPYAVGYSAALNSSGGKERIRGAGWVLVDPETSFHWSSKNGESFYGDYVFTQRASDVERLLDEERVVTPGALPTYHPFRNLSVRPVKGDSGGPLYALDSLGRETLIGVAKTAFPPDNFKADSGAGDATWVDISAYAQPLAAMKQALESTPLPGTSPRTGLLPIRWQFFWDSKDVLNFYSVSPLLSLGRFYLDPPAGEFEELSVSTPGVTFAAMLLPNVDAAITAGTLKIEYFHDGHGQFVDSTWTRESDQWIVFGEKYSKLRVSGLGVPVGTMLTFGIELNDPSFEGTSIEWRNVGALAAVPEASTTGLILVGLLSMAARRSILRKA